MSKYGSKGETATIILLALYDKTSNLVIPAPHQQCQKAVLQRPGKYCHHPGRQKLPSSDSLLGCFKLAVV